ncbi:MAG TPA: winged helix-turn-helix domain-containing protein [Steroidobacteraceae bacterium]|nr:winged helix-turn-helix domain-containing protein [Steroidobacteraceae bacterium]
MHESADTHFDGWVFRSKSGELLRGAARTRLQDLPGQILDELLSHPGELVTREQLIARLWPKGVVDFEMGLNTAMRKLRLALGDDAETPRYIETIPRKGYRFIAKIDTPGQSADVAAVVPPGKPRTVALAVAGLLLLGGALGLALFFKTSRPPENGAVAPTLAAVADTLAVLPFRPLLADERNPSLELGMTNTLISQLSNLPGVRVSPLSSVRPYAAVDQDAIAAGKKLAVATVLEGSIQNDAKRIRVTARLLRVSDGRPMWSRQFDAPMSDIFAVQDAIATQVVAALAITLSAASQERLLRQFTTSVEAYQLYVSGLYNWQRRLPQAVGEFEAALRIDPRYALAWAGLADALSAQGVYGYEPPAAVFPRAKAAALKAIELAPDLVEAQVSLGHILVQYDQRYAEGEKQYLAARAVKEDYATLWQRLAIVRLYLGHLDAGLSDMQHAQQLEPTTLAYGANIGMMLYFSRSYDKAIEQLNRILELDPHQDQALTILGRALVETGKYDEALKRFAARSEPTPGSEGDVGRAYARGGHAGDAHAQIDRLKARSAQGFGVSYDLASIHAALREIPEACAALARAVADHSQMIGTLKVDPAMDNLRSAPCYANIERQLYAQ